MTNIAIFPPINPKLVFDVIDCCFKFQSEMLPHLNPYLHMNKFQKTFKNLSIFQKFPGKNARGFPRFVVDWM